MAFLRNLTKSPPLSRTFFSWFGWNTRPAKSGSGMPPPSNKLKGQEGQGKIIGKKFYEDSKTKFKEWFPGEQYDPDDCIKVQFTDIFEDADKYHNIKSTWRKDLPDAELDLIKYNPETKEYEIKKIKAREYFTPLRVVFVGIVGAFVPECTEEVAWDWARRANRIKKLWRINEIVLVSMNDAYVMQNFAKKLNYTDTISFIADWNGVFTKNCETEIEFDSGTGLGTRSQRYMSPTIYGRMKAIYQSVHGDKLAYTTASHPAFLWRLLRSKKGNLRIWL